MLIYNLEVTEDTPIRLSGYQLGIILNLSVDELVNRMDILEKELTACVVVASLYNRVNPAG